MIGRRLSCFLVLSMGLAVLAMKGPFLLGAGFRNRAAMVLAKALCLDPRMTCLSIETAEDSRAALMTSSRIDPGSCQGSRLLWQTNFLVEERGGLPGPCDDDLDLDIMAMWIHRQGNVYAAEGAKERAVAAYEAGISLGETRSLSKLYLDQGKLWLQDGEYDKALSSSRSALINADSVLIISWAHFYSGRALVELGQSSAAIPHLTTAVQLAPERPWFHVALGRAYEAVGHVEAARAEYRAALQIDPTLKGVKQYLEALDAP